MPTTNHWAVLSAGFQLHFFCFYLAFFAHILEPAAIIPTAREIWSSAHVRLSEKKEVKETKKEKKKPQEPQQYGKISLVARRLQSEDGSKTSETGWPHPRQPRCGFASGSSSPFLAQRAD